MNHSVNRLHKLLLVAIAASVTGFLWMSYPEPQLRNDSPGYIEFAQAIADGTIFATPDDLANVPYARAVRTPGFPLAILLATQGNFAAIERLLLLHLLIALAAMLATAVLLRDAVPVALSAAAVGIVQLLMHDYYFAVMTEWLAFNGLIVFFALTVGVCRQASLARWLGLSLLAAALILTRPALLPLVAVVPLLYCLLSIGALRRSAPGLIAVGAGLLPLFAWIMFNGLQLGSFSVAQLSGLNLLGVGSQIGYALPEASDPPHVQRFFDEFNAQKYPAVGEEAAFIENLDAEYNKFRFESNIFFVAFRLKDDTWGFLPFDREFMAVYGKRALAANLDHYAIYLWTGIKRFGSYGWPITMLMLLAAALYSLWRGINAPLALAAITMTVVHISQGLVISGFQAVSERYVITSYYPCMLALGLTAVALALTAARERGLYSLLPVWLERPAKALLVTKS